MTPTAASTYTGLVVGTEEITASQTGGQSEGALALGSWMAPMPCGPLPPEAMTTACALMKLGANKFSSEPSLLQNLLRMTSVGQEDVETAIAESGCTPSALLAAYMHNIGVVSESSDALCQSEYDEDKEKLAMERRSALVQDMLQVIESGPVPISELGSKRPSKSKGKKALMYQGDRQSLNCRHAKGQNLSSPLYFPSQPQGGHTFCDNILSDLLGLPLNMMNSSPLFSWDASGQSQLSYQGPLHPSSQGHDVSGVMGRHWSQAMAQIKLNDLAGFHHPHLGGAFLPGAFHPAF